MTKRVDAVAVVVGLLGPALLALLPALAAGEPDATEGVPGTGDVAWWLGMVLLLAQGAALVGRTRRPEVVAIAVAAAVPLGGAVGLGGALGLTSLAVLVAAYALATRRRLEQAWPVHLAVVGLVALGHTIAGIDTDASVVEALGAGVLQGAFVTGLPLAVAALVVARRETASAQAERLVALEREHDALVAAAVARERTAMARELHDIAAHHLTGIAVLSSAIAAQIDTDPAGAKAAVADVRRQSTAVLRDLRSLVGLLRDPGRDDSGVRTETLAGIPGLVGAATVPDVHLTVLGPGDGAGIGPLAQLAAYRMVQESLANAARHAAGARVEVTVDDREPDALRVTVTNGTGRPSPDAGGRGGLGLVGMRERAELTGSRLDVGPVDDGWRVRLVVPRNPEEGA